MQYTKERRPITERVPLYCQTTGKLIARVSIAGSWSPDMRQWLWCRGCHYEHEITYQHIEHARNQ